MKKVALKVLTRLILGLVIVAPFLNQSASACALGLGEKKVPACLKK